MLPLGLSMLWESVEPEAALKQRFGFNSFRAATHWVSAVLEQTWGLTPSNAREWRSVTRTRSCGLRAPAVGWW
ncbi:hypothetical protein [uncultured Rhodococcus sp.]|uniref:hypothetical protein n=1 Tax=uncultured Rhodococcus sp. TaxID=194249 RepID=UPI0028DB1DB4|nr:hypothetical protein [uncultured Rhodococcus sp.]